MNRPLAVLVMGLLVSWYALSVDAASIDCVPNKGCPKGIKPPKCCALPKCEFFYALMMARAELYANSANAQYGGMLKYALDESGNTLQYSRRALSEVMQEARGSNKKCPARDFYIEPPSLLVLSTEQCAIFSNATGKPREIGLEEFDLRSNSCSEIVEAEWARAQQEQFYCNRPYQPNPQDDFETYRKRNESAARAKVRSLEASLLQYRRACTMVTDARIARHVAKLGLKSLGDDTSKKPKKTTKAKRSRKAR